MSLKGKVIGGKLTKQDQMEYLVAIYKISHQICTGFLLSEKHIATTATCLAELFIKRIFHNYYAKSKYDTKLPTPMKRFFKQIEIHENYVYDEATPINDVGLITVSY